MPKRITIAMLCSLLVPVAAMADMTMSDCLVTLIEEAQVPAQEAGVLTEVAVKEGDQVAEGGLLARIDDTQAQMQLKAARFKLDVAKEEASNDVNIRYAQASTRVAEAEYMVNKEACDKVPGAIPATEMRRLLLTYHRAKLEIEQAQMQFRIAALETNVAQAEVDAAAEGVRRRKILAPMDAMVVERFRHHGEWVQPGDPVMHIVRIDRLRVQGYIRATDHAAGEIDGRDVTVDVELTRGRQESFRGKVVFVSPLVQAGGEYQVWAEVENRRDPRNNHWLLQPGLDASMTIHTR